MGGLDHAKETATGLGRGLVVRIRPGGVVRGCLGFGVEDFAGLLRGAGDALADEVEKAGGLTPRLTPEQRADSNIELGRLSRARELGPVLDGITVPVRYVLASGSSLGSKGDEQEEIRASLDQVFERDPNVRLSAKVASNHGAILKKDFPAVAEAVREVAALDRGEH